PATTTSATASMTNPPSDKITPRFDAPTGVGDSRQRCFHACLPLGSHLLSRLTTPSRRRGLPHRGRSLRALHDVQVREHVDVGVALDDELALAILLDPAHPRLGRPVPHEPRDGDVPDVDLKNLLGPPAFLDPLGLI